MILQHVIFFAILLKLGTNHVPFMASLKCTQARSSKKCVNIWLQKLNTKAPIAITKDITVIVVKLVFITYQYMRKWPCI